MDLIMTYRCYCNKCNTFYSDDLMTDNLCPVCEDDNTEVMDDDIEQEAWEPMAEDLEEMYEDYMAQLAAEDPIKVIGAQ